MKWILLYIELTAALLCGCAKINETNAANKPGDDPKDVVVVPPVPAPPVVEKCGCDHPCKCASTPGNKACKCPKCRCDVKPVNPKPSPKCDCDFCRCKGVCECGYEVQVKAAPVRTYFEFHTAAACGVCQQWKANELTSMEAAGWIVGDAGHIRIVEHATIDESLPKFVFFKGGKQIGQHVGYLDAFQIAERLKGMAAVNNDGGNWLNYGQSQPFQFFQGQCVGGSCR